MVADIDLVHQTASIIALTIAIIALLSSFGGAWWWFHKIAVIVEKIMTQVLGDESEEIPSLRDDRKQAKAFRDEVMAILIMPDGVDVQDALNKHIADSEADRDDMRERFAHIEHRLDLMGVPDDGNEKFR